MKLHQQDHSNRTGLAVSVEHARPMLQNMRGTPSSEGDADDVAQVRIEYAKRVEPIGTLPPAVNGARAGARGKSASPVLLDKLGERLAFERSGVRLYDALISKFDAYGSWKDGPGRADLEEIRGEEQEHFELLRELLTSLGGDATAVTPSADLHGVAAKGLPEVVTDPRTSLAQCLEAILIAELVDNDCWESLIDLCASTGQQSLVPRLEAALAQEREHLRRVRLWLGAALSRSATGALQQPFSERTRRREAAAEARASAAPRRTKKASKRRKASSTTAARKKAKRSSKSKSKPRARRRP